MPSSEESVVKTPTQIIYQWWQKYSAQTPRGEKSLKGEFANLRRCKTVQEIYFTPQYQSFYHLLNNTKWQNKQALAVIAGVLAYVKPHDKFEKPEVTFEVKENPNYKPKQAVAFYLSTSSQNSEKPLVSETRFMRLMKVKEYNELFPAMIRIVHLAGDSVPLFHLIDSLYWWNDQTRCDWTFEYFANLPDKSK